MRWLLIWLFGSVLVTIVAVAAPAEQSETYQYLCIGDFSCYGSAVKYSFALLQSTECSREALGFTAPSGSYSYSFFQVPFNMSLPVVVNISIDWREQIPPTSTPTVETTERSLLHFDYEYVAINFTSGAVVSNMLQVQPNAVNDSQSVSSYFTLDETREVFFIGNEQVLQDRQRVDIFHAYQHGRRRAQPGVSYSPVLLVQLMAGNATGAWDQDQFLTWDPTAWEPITYNCNCQLLPWTDTRADRYNGISNTSCSEGDSCQVDFFYLDQQGKCSAQQTQVVPSIDKISKESKAAIGVISGLVLLVGVCWSMLLLYRLGKHGRISNPNHASQIGP
jgi:hypothetical protein